MFSDFSSRLTKGVKSLTAVVGGTGEDGAQYVPTSEEDAECMAEWGITLEQEEILLAQLRDELLLEVQLGPDWDHNTLRRFLRARKHDIPKAKAMVLAALKWRADNGIDTILQDFDFPERAHFNQYYPEGFYCTDREGRPVYVQQPGSIDTEALWKFTTLERSVKYHITQQERYVRRVAPAASVAAGRLREQSLVLIDMDGVGVSTLTGEVRNIMARIMSIDQDNYPELMYKSVIVNAPTTFRAIWALVKYLLDARTQAKIEVLSSDWRTELQAYIAPENLMEKYGGTNKAALSDEPGPWQDPAIMAEVDRRQAAQRAQPAAAADGAAAPAAAQA